MEAMKEIAVEQNSIAASQPGSGRRRGSILLLTPTTKSQPKSILSTNDKNSVDGRRSNRLRLKKVYFQVTKIWFV
jgi:hypothetical protein